MRNAVEKINQIHENRVFDAGEAGTCFRFLALRLSRERGTFTLLGSQRLMQRPQKELVQILHQLGVKSELTAKGLRISSHGWQVPPEGIHVDRQQSSQFVSAVVLNSWRLPFALRIFWQGEVASESYFRLTLDMVKRWGMNYIELVDGIEIPPFQEPQCRLEKIECDISSAFAIAAAAALDGFCQIRNFPLISHQPDFQFVSFLQKLKHQVDLGRDGLRVQKSELTAPGLFEIGSAPDLFPVLCVLCAFVPGRSKIYGANQLQYKESHRIHKTAELLRLIGRTVEEFEDGLEVLGHSGAENLHPIEFDPDHDHRMAMAAGLVKLKGFPIKILHPEVVNKSFPEFWKILAIEL